MLGLEVLSLVAGGMVAAGALEAATHRRRLNKIPVRVHVSGTRGKSSVTRLIAAGLRAGGVPTAAKTTGTLARMILPDARELPVFRPAGANILEQSRIVAAAEGMGVKALVMECMALQPELHWLSEHKLVRGTHGVITNARADHLDVMGPTEQDVALCLGGMCPVNGVLYTAERRHLAILADCAKDRGTRLVAVTEEDVARITEAELNRFSYTEHAENLALALRVLEDLDIDRQTALEGMWAAQPDPGALTVHRVDFFGRKALFVNAFAANDPESTERIWGMLVKRYPEYERRVAIFNLRADRASRTLQLANDCNFWVDANHVILIGTGAYLFTRAAAARGVGPGRFTYGEQLPVPEIFEAIIGQCTEPTLVVGIGNIGGPGLPLVRYVDNRSTREDKPW